MKKYNLIWFWATLMGITMLPTSLFAQKAECATSFLKVKEYPIIEMGDLYPHYDALDSLLSKCKIEDKDWIKKVLDLAIEKEDSLINHNFPWVYFVYLYRKADREKDATNLLDKLISYSEENEFDLNGDFYIERGIKYQSTGNYVQEIECYQKGLKAYQRDESVNILYALSVLGRLYLDLGDLNTAKQYSLKALERSEKLTSTSHRYYNLANISNDLAHIYVQKDSLIEAQNYFNLASETAEKQGNYNLTLLIYDSNIKFYSDNNNLAKAKELVRTSENLIKEIKEKNEWELDHQRLAYHDLTLAKYAIKSNNPVYLKDPKNISSLNMSNQTLKEYHQFAINYCKAKGYTKRALSYSEDLTEISIKDAAEQKMSAIDLILEKEDNARLQRENVLLLESRRKRKIQQYFTIALLSFLGISLLYLYYYLRSSREYNKKIEDKNEKIELQYKELERISYVMTHDLKEPINTVNSFTGLLINRHIDRLDEKGKNYFQIIKDASQTMLNSVNMLHNYLLLGVKSELKMTDLNSVWRNAENNLKAIVLKSGAQLDSATLPQLKCYEQDMITLFQNLLSNSIKYSKKGIPPKITIDCKQSADHYTISFKDNGIGMTGHLAKNAFELFERLHTNTAIEGSGIGLANVRKIVEQHKGEIWIETELNQGASVLFTISKRLN